jgi:flagellar hook-basal body complex protein FliE
MISAIQASSAYARMGKAAPTAPVEAAPGFDNQVANAIRNVDAMQNESSEALRLLASGETVDLHGTMVALEKADIALRTMVSVRNRVVAAYEQVMNMAI